MATMRLRYVHEYVDRHGRVRRYFRKGTAKRISLPGHPGSREFMQAYQAALDGYEQPGPTPIGLDRSPPGSLSALIASYYSSARRWLGLRKRRTGPRLSDFGASMATSQSL